jgi:hypothetical protein
MDRLRDTPPLDLAAMSIDLGAVQVLLAAMLKAIAGRTPSIYADFARALDHELDDLRVETDDPEVLLRWLAVKAVAEEVARGAGSGSYLRVVRPAAFSG